MGSFGVILFRWNSLSRLPSGGEKRDFKEKHIKHSFAEDKLI